MDIQDALQLTAQRARRLALKQDKKPVLIPLL